MTDPFLAATNLAAYISWGSHGWLGPSFPTNLLHWSGNSGWWIIETIESFNGQRSVSFQSFFLEWFYGNAFGGSNYSNTPVGAVSQVDEPNGGVNYAPTYFGLWASGKSFGMCAWCSGRTDYLQAVGDPFVAK